MSAAAEAIGWHCINSEATPGADFTVLWQDTTVAAERMMQLKPYQVCGAILVGLSHDE